MSIDDAFSRALRLHQVIKSNRKIQQEKGIKFITMK